jgi:hypothetical protein
MIGLFQGVRRDIVFNYYLPIHCWIIENGPCYVNPDNKTTVINKYRLVC